MFNLFKKDKNEKGGNEMKAEAEFEDLPMDDEQLEEQEEKPKPKKAVPVRNEVRTSQRRYVAVHQPEMNGVYDSLENKTVAVDIWDMLAEIKNDLESIKRSVGV